MLENTSLDEGFFENKQLNVKVKSAFQGTAKWGKFVAIVGLVLVGGWFLFQISIIVAVLFNKGFSSYGAGKAIGEIFVWSLNLIPFILLLKFSNSMKTGLQINGEEAFTKALLQHRNLFRYLGVLWIFYLVVFVITLAVLGTSGLGF